MFDNKDDREAFFTAMKEMEQQNTTCTNKATFLDNVVLGKEQVTFAVIDRCREAVLQLRQSHHVFAKLHQKYKGTPLGAEHQSRLRDLSNSIESTSERATEALNDIISWVPAAVNTRALGNAR